MATATRQVLSISLPREMAREIEQVSEFEQRTTSELVREAIRGYLKEHKQRIPVAAATAYELHAIARGNKEIKTGQYVNLRDILK